MDKIDESAFTTAYFRMEADGKNYSSRELRDFLEYYFYFAEKKGKTPPTTSTVAEKRFHAGYRVDCRCGGFTVSYRSRAGTRIACPCGEVIEIVRETDTLGEIGRPVTEEDLLNAGWEAREFYDQWRREVMWRHKERHPCWVTYSTALEIERRSRVPFVQYETIEDFLRALPHDCPLVGVEFPHEQARPLSRFIHPPRAAYLLGAEDHGLSKRATEACQHVIMIPGSVLEQSLNVAVAGSIVLYDRISRAHGRKIELAGGVA